MQFDFQIPGHLQLDNHELAELSHEDGIQLIEEMYSAQHPNFSVQDMDTSYDEMYHVPADTNCDLEQAHKMINGINEIMQSNQKGALSDGSLYLLLLQQGTSAGLDDTKEIDIGSNMIEARALLQRAQQELDKLRHTQQEMAPHFLWSLGEYTMLRWVFVESRLWEYYLRVWCWCNDDMVIGYLAM